MTKQNYLLAKALSYKPKRRTSTHKFIQEEIELYISWLKGDVEMAAVAYALDIKKQKTSIIPLRATQALKQAFDEHKIEVIWLPKKSDKERMGV